MKIRLILQTGLVLIAFGIFIILYAQESNNFLIKEMVKVGVLQIFAEGLASKTLS